MDYKERLALFYEKYAPDKLDKVEELLEKSKGKEEQLFAKLVDKYGPEPKEAQSSAPSESKKTRKESKAKQRTRQAQQQQHQQQEPLEQEEEEEEDEPRDGVQEPESSAPAATNGEEQVEYGSRSWWKARLMRFYAKYAPTKTEQDVNGLLDKAKDNPHQLTKLFVMLEQKYGPEPEPSSDEEEDDEDQAEAQEEEEEGEEEETEDSPDAIPGLRKVVYCPVDGMPCEYSEYFETFKQALPWIAGHMPELPLATQQDKTALEYCQSLGLEPIAENVKVAKADKAQARKRGGNTKKGDGKILIESVNRRKKAISMVKGLEHVEGVKLKDAAKQLGKKFASGACVKQTNSGEDMIEIQGDWSYELPQVLLDFFPNVDKKSVYTVDEDGKKERAFD